MLAKRSLYVLNAPLVGKKKVGDWANFHAVRNNFFNMKQFKRHDGFRGEPLFYGLRPITVNPTEKNVQKRLMQKRPIKKKK